MFYPIKGGKKIIVGEGFPCYIPPPPSDKSQIINYGLPKEEQYWKRQPVPEFYTERSLEEEYQREKEMQLVLSGQKEKVTFVDPVLERYRRREWFRRWYGVHIMINGQLEFLTNHHYWYLQWCQFDSPRNEGYPLYYEFSRDNFYIRQWCEENPKSMGYMMIASRGTGKCLGKGTKIMMYEGGTKNVEDIVVGDLLMGPDSKPRKVIELSRGIDDLFEVVQNRGMSYVVNSKHILSLKRNSGKSFVGKAKKNGKYYNRFPQYGNIVNMPVLEFERQTQTFKNYFSGYKVGVNYERREVRINPYFLGLWLGDGHSIGPTITTMDKEIVQWLESFAESINQRLSCQKSNPSNAGKLYYIGKKGGVRSAANPLLDLLRGYDLIQNKHIPFDYLYNTREVRLKLLAGLIDSDGHFSKGRYEIAQVNKKLANEILILVNGLGFRSSIHEKVVNGTTYYRIGFSGTSNIPVLLDRKVNRGKPNKDVLLTRIDEINYLGKGEFFGFSLDGDHLFCLEDGTVTHNTNEEMACISNRATALHKHRVAVQGKHFEVDAKGVMIQSKLVPLFNALPKFFKPEFAHGTNPQEALIFKRPTTKGRLAKGVKHGPDLELDSTIFAAQPGVKALDTETLNDLVETEIGKTNPATVADIYDRHETNLKCVFRNHLKVGLLRKESTVEEMDEGGDPCHRLWKDSDPRVLDGSGFTVSKIHRHLISALDTDTSEVEYIDAKGKNWGAPCDKYGHVDREIANVKIQNDLDAVKHDLVRLSSRMRKSPRNESEAFIKDQSKSIFNIMKCTNRMEHIRNVMHKKPYVKGNLYWLKDKFGPVWWERDDHAGRFNCAWLPDEFSQIKDPTKVKILNNFTKEWGYDRSGNPRELIVPGNNHLFRVSTDPIKYAKTKDPRASKAAIHAFRLYDHLVDGGKPRDQWQSHNFFFEYCQRPEDPMTYLEDLAMLCIFLGAKVLPERNIPAANQYFEQNGLEKLLAYPSEFVQGIGLDVQTQSDDAGYASTTEVIDYYTRRLIPFINQDIDRMPFDDTIEDWTGFDPKDPTKSHLTVSSGFALVHAEKVSEIERPPESKISDWFDEVDNSGLVGTLVEEQD